MDYLRTPLRFRAEDYEPLRIDELAVRARVSRAFLRLCVENGCPTRRDRLSQASLLNWLLENHQKIREAAGLKPHAPIEGVDGESFTRLRLANTMLTLLEYAETRSSEKREKDELRAVQKLVDQAVDRLP